MEKIDAFLVLCPLFPTKLPPLGLAYLAEYLERSGLNVKCFDINNILYNRADNEQKVAWNIQNNPGLALSLTKKHININNPIIRDFLDKILELNPSIISFSCFKSNHYPTFEIIKIIKKHHLATKILCGGPEIWGIHRKKGSLWLKNAGIDAIVIGEGEQALARLSRNFPNSNELVVVEHEEIKDLDSIPYPSFSQLDRNAYGIRTQVPILMSRGCIRLCGFCSERLLYKEYRVRSAVHVIEEITSHVKRGITSFVFYDSLINGNLKALEDLCDTIIMTGVPITWEAQCVIRRDMTTELLKKMKQAGCFNLFIGLESASDQVLERMRKGITKADARTFFEKLKEAGLHFEISFITAFPQETEKEFEETCDFIRTNKEIIPKIAQVNPYVPYDGTIIGEVNPNVDETLGKERMRRLVELFEEENIPYTKSYIGNLLPKGRSNAL
jgi:anaerobic magnesium-protoporphyrin IX monomethyl ester cyclase